MAKKAQSRKRAAASKTARFSKKKVAPTRKASRKKADPGAKASRAAELSRRKYLEAIGLYEQALEALQRRDLKVAATRFDRLIEEFPDERELHERSRRYLQICERAAAPEPEPHGIEERVYAATLALNAGSEREALRHLEAADAEAPDSEQVQYMLAVARAAAGDQSRAVSHLHRAIELNPDNRFLARHEPSFKSLRDDEAFRRMLS